MMARLLLLTLAALLARCAPFPVGQTGNVCRASATLSVLAGSSRSSIAASCLSDSKPSIVAQQQQLPLIEPDSAVYLDFICTLANIQSCNYILRDIREANRFLVNALALTHPVVVKILVGPQPSPSTAYLGVTWTSAYWTCESDLHGRVLMPQSLVKQLLPEQSRNGRIERSDLDIDIRLNVTNNDPLVWWKEQSPKINPAQKDVSLLYIHELLHGLGFISFWTQYNIADETYILPYWSLLNSSINQYPHVVYDSLLYYGPQNSSFRNLGNIIMEEVLPPISLFSSQLPRSKSIDDMQSGVDFAKSGSAAKGSISVKQMDQFKTWRMSSAAQISMQLSSDLNAEVASAWIRDITSTTISSSLNSSGVFNDTLLFVETRAREGSTPFTHLNGADYANTNEFTVSLYAGFGRSLADTLLLYTNLIGPKTIRALQLMGYTPININSSNTATTITLIGDKPFHRFSFSNESDPVTMYYVSDGLLVARAGQGNDRKNESNSDTNSNSHIVMSAGRLSTNTMNTLLWVIILTLHLLLLTI